MIIAFVMITIALILSYITHSRNRFLVVLYLYILFSINFIYILMADLGFVPTASGLRLVYPTFSIPILAIVFRMFVKKGKVKLERNY